MNISEMKVGHKAVYAPTSKEKIVVVIKAITKEGIVLIRDSFGKVTDVAPEKITKILGAV